MPTDRPIYEDADYRYGAWGGCLAGSKQQTGRCVAAIFDGGHISRQCLRARGHGYRGLYCNQHAKEKRHAD